MADVRYRADFVRCTPESRRGSGRSRESEVEHPAGIWKRESEKMLRGFWSGIDPVGTLLGEHLEDDAAEVTAEGTNGLVVSLSFGAFFS